MQARTQYAYPSNASKGTNCISTYFDQTFPWKQVYLYLCSPNKSHSSEFTKWFSWCVGQTQLMQARTQSESQHVLSNPLICQPENKMYLNMCWTFPSYASEDSTCISTCGDQSHPMPARTQNVLYMYWPNHSDASEDTKCISICVEQTPPMTARTQKIYQLVLTKHPPCQRGNKMHFNMYWVLSSQVELNIPYFSLLITFLLF